jgi:hypothetical protein
LRLPRKWFSEASQAWQVVWPRCRGDVLQVGEDGVVDPRLDDAIHHVPRWNANICGVHQHVIRERVTPKGEHCIIAPPGIVRGGEV